MAPLCEYAFMRTTVDLPPELVTALKRRAVEEGISFKAIYNRALARELGHVQRPSSKPNDRSQPVKRKKPHLRF